jgi:hypothetical protein
MKNIKIITLVLLIATSGILPSCKKDKKGGNECAKVDFEQKALADYTHPCAVAISKSGIVAVVEYNGFNAYGTNGTTTIWKSMDDFLAKKAPVQSFLSRGAEAAIFDASENLYIAETEATAGIRVYQKTGNVSYQYKTLIQGDGITGGFVNPRGMAFDAAGHLFIANDGVGNIVRITDPLNNGPKQIIGADFDSAKGLAIIGNNMYVTVYNQNQVWKCTLKENGDFGEIVATYDVNKPVDVAVKDGVLAVSSPESGTVDIIDPEKIGRSGEPFTGCKKVLTVGNNVFGLAFNPLENGLLVAHLDLNRVLYYKTQ